MADKDGDDVEGGVIATFVSLSRVVMIDDETKSRSTIENGPRDSAVVSVICAKGSRVYVPLNRCKRLNHSIKTVASWSGHRVGHLCDNLIIANLTYFCDVLWLRLLCCFVCLIVCLFV